ncbi:16S rRNA (cytosine(1402)-N(4))-methyltransferase RsmH [Candidatus Wolfebacteria bacterium]|nr:16S rRNA (cytosine(1402)-N(4))-methyltransferase RsmH [Candidatus Wolfebacteria bacterium]
MHLPVLTKEVLEFLDPKAGENFIDCTVDGGGHAMEILKKISPAGKLLGIDLDGEMIAALEARIKKENSKNLIVVEGNFKNLKKIAEENNFKNISGILIDLGWSSIQIEKSGRGFSFLKNEPLDMRYSNTGMTAAEAVNRLNEKELADIFWQYGEERLSRRIAKKIIEARRKKRILTTIDLVDVIKTAVPKSYERGRIHPATRTFQALRIYVNQELENLKEVLPRATEILAPGGRLAVISFHSLEDRIVKKFFREAKKEGGFEILTKKPVTPSEEELTANPRSRSAKLRAAFKK